MHSNREFEANLRGIIKSAQRRPSRPRQASITIGFNNFRSHSPENERKSANDGDKESENTVKLKMCCCKFTSLMLSHLGCFIIVIVYVIMGGFLFNYLEAGNEISSCLQIQSKYQEKLYQTANVLYAVSQGTNATQAQITVVENLHEFSAYVYSLITDPHINCSRYSDGSLLPSWNIVNAAYFCVTIVTTIGYGHIYPVTQWGQIICIVYGILGIPIMLLFLSKIGEPTALMFRTFYMNICCCKCFIKKIPGESQVQHQSEWTVNNVEDGNATKPPPVKVVEVIEDEEDEEDKDELVNIPITVTMMLLGLYVILGAAVFRLWENWTLVEGAYFSFITLTTIGFGDYVPGRYGPFNSASIITELTVGCIYCLFGLALLSMCVNLIQDEVSAKFRWIGTKCGVSKTEEDEEEDEEGEDEDDADDEDDEEETDGEEISDGDLGKSSNSKPPPVPLRSHAGGRQVESHA